MARVLSFSVWNSKINPICSSHFFVIPRDHRVEEKVLATIRETLQLYCKAWRILYEKWNAQKRSESVVWYKYDDWWLWTDRRSQLRLVSTSPHLHTFCGMIKETRASHVPAIVSRVSQWKRSSVHTSQQIFYVVLNWINVQMPARGLRTDKGVFWDSSSVTLFISLNLLGLSWRCRIFLESFFNWIAKKHFKTLQ